MDLGSQNFENILVIYQILNTYIDFYRLSSQKFNSPQIWAKSLISQKKIKPLVVS